MNLFKKLSAFLLSIILILSASACSGDYRDAYIYFEFEKLPSTLDPQLVSSREESVVVRCLFDTLLRYDEDGNIVPSAASSYEKDNLTYTFSISPDAHWTNGEKLTAYDFEFAFKRALDPKTAAPAAATLSSVKSAEAVDDNTFIITLSQDDPDFLNTLTSPITMPCNQAFFNECKGRYGLGIDCVLACGSYYIRKWQTEGKFLIRLAKNLDYKSNFEARSMRVYFTCDERNNYEMLSENDTDFAFLSSEEAKNADINGLNISELENISYLLFISPEMDEDIRLAIMKSVKLDSKIYDDFFGARVSKSIAPKSLNVTLSDFTGDFPYDIRNAAYLYSEAILNSNDSSLSGINIKCYNDPAALATAKALSAHWQQNLGAFVNLEEVSSVNSLQSNYNNGNYSLLIMPITASFRHSSSYISKLGINANDMQSAQDIMGSSSLCYPLFNQCSFLASVPLIENNDSIIQNGIPDIALAIKRE